MAFTLADAKAYIKDRNWGDDSAKGVRQAIKVANAASQAIRRLGKWSFDSRNSTLDFAALINTGTLSIAAGGTAVTGVGTAWVSGDVGKYFRFNGEPLTYLVTAVGSTTTATISPAYKGSTSLSAVTYELVQSRVAMPARFRSLSMPMIEEGIWRLEPTQNLEDILQAIRLRKEVSIPRAYAVEWVETTGTYPAPYMWVYPGPAQANSIGIQYYVWPAVLSADGDDFGLPSSASAEALLWKFIDGYVLHEKGKVAEAHAVLSEARADAMDVLGEFRPIDDPGQREEYTERPTRWNFRRRWGPGEPLYP